MRRSAAIRGFVCAAALALAAFASAPAHAATGHIFDGQNVPEHTVTAGAETDLPLRLRPRKYLVLDLKEPFGRAEVDNPSKVTVVPYGFRSVAVYPHQEGAAHITIYGRSGKVLMARYAVVASIEKRYVRLHEVCKDASSQNCGRTITYYCPNFCYQTRIAAAPGENRPVQ
jgi:hypothetical protein